MYAFSWRYAIYAGVENVLYYRPVCNDFGSYNSQLADKTTMFQNFYVAQIYSTIVRLTAMLIITITGDHTTIVLDVARPGMRFRVELNLHHEVLRQFAVSAVRRARKCLMSYVGDESRFILSNHYEFIHCRAMFTDKML